MMVTKCQIKQRIGAFAYLVLFVCLPTQNWARSTITASTYHKVELKHCFNSKHGSYRSLVSAKEACSLDSNCYGVNDAACDNDGPFYLCDLAGANIQASGGSCIYVEDTLDDWSSVQDTEPSGILWYTGSGHGCWNAHGQCYWWDLKVAIRECRAWDECKYIYQSEKHTPATPGNPTYTARTVGDTRASVGDVLWMIKDNVVSDDWSSVQDTEPSGILWYTASDHGCLNAHGQCYWWDLEVAKKECRAWDECKYLYQSEKHTPATPGNATYTARTVGDTSASVGDVLWMIKDNVVSGCRTEVGAACVFPFVYKNTTYSTCTAIDSANKKPWCAIAPTAVGGIVESPNWGDCHESCADCTRHSQCGSDEICRNSKCEPNNVAEHVNGYVKINDLYCTMETEYKSRYATVDLATDACGDSADCIAVFDQYCDGANYYLCLKSLDDSIKHSVEGSCVYVDE